MGPALSFGTNVEGPYVGAIEKIIDKRGKLRWVGAVTLTGAGIADQVKNLSLTAEEDYNKFGATRLSAPSEVFIASADVTSNNGISAYGSGN